MLTWRKTSTGNLTAHDGTNSYVIRGPIMGKPMYWLYLNHGRFTPTGDYNDAVHFASVAQAKAFAEKLAERLR